MSLEKAIEELTQALRENTETLNSLNKLASAKPAKAEAPAKTEKAAKTEKTAAKKSKDISYEDLRNTLGNFMQQTDDADERKARRTFVKDLLEKYGAETSQDIPANKRAEVIAALDDFSFESGDDEDLL